MCFLAGASGVRHWLLASNSDNPYTTKNHVLVEESGRHAYLAVRVVPPPAEKPVPWAGMLTRGVNAAGLGFTYAFVLEPDTPDYPAQAWTGEMLATASSVAEAVAYVREHPANTVLPGNYLIADRSGGMAVVEAGAGRVEVHLPETRTETRSNVWQCLADSCAPSWDMDTASTHRHGRGADLLHALPEVSPDALRQVLCDHRDDGGPIGEHGRSVCNHGTTDGTISSEVIDPAGHLWFGFGFPCGDRQGYEQDSRRSWGRLMRFSLVPGCGSGDVTTPDGSITPLGVRLMA